MYLKAKHTINGLKPGGESIIRGEVFIADEKDAERLLEIDFAEVIEEEVVDVRSAAGDEQTQPADKPKDAGNDAPVAAAAAAGEAQK